MTAWQQLRARFAAPKIAESPILEELAPAAPFFGALSPFAFPSANDPLAGPSGYALCDKMQADAQVKACLTVKKFAALSRGWEIHPASTSPADTQIAGFVRFALAGMRSALADSLYDCLDALAKGVSVLEINYKRVEHGPYAAWVALDSLKAKDPALFQFETDSFWNLTGLRGANGARYPVEKFAIYSYMPAYENPLGTSDLRAAYRAWYAKDWLLKWWTKYLEKFGSPTVMASYVARDGFGQDQQRQLLSLIAGVQNETAFVLPEDIKISLLEPGRRADTAFADAVAFFDRAIAKSILGQNLTTDSTGAGATYALGQVHQDMLQFYLLKLQRDLEESVMNSQIIKRLVAFNFGPAAPVPTFRLGALDDSRLAALGQLITGLVSGGIIAPDEPWIREFLGLPAKEQSLMST